MNLECLVLYLDNNNLGGNALDFKYLADGLK